MVFCIHLSVTRTFYGEEGETFYTLDTLHIISHSVKALTKTKNTNSNQRLDFILSSSTNGLLRKEVLLHLSPLSDARTLSEGHCLERGHIHTHTHLTAIFQDYPGESVPER